MKRQPAKKRQSPFVIQPVFGKWGVYRRGGPQIVLRHLDSFDTEPQAEAEVRRLNELLREALDGKQAVADEDAA